MDRLKRHVPALVSLLGSLGLGLTLTYFIGVGLALQSGWRAWSSFFTTWAPRLVVLPVGLLLTHLYLRMHLGAWLVDEGRLEEAIEYTSSRLEHNLMRGRRETLYHRLALVRALVCQHDYERAAHHLESGYSIPQSGRMAARIRRWQAEVGLRRHDPDAVREAYDRGESLSGDATALARLSAARAELAARETARSEFIQYAESADWLDDEDPRVELAWILGVSVFEEDEEEWEWALERLTTIRSAILEEIPGRAGELDAMRADLLAKLGDHSQARELLEEARELECDSYAEGVIERLEAQIESSL